MACWGPAVLPLVACWPSMRLPLLLKPWEVLDRLYTIDHATDPTRQERAWEAMDIRKFWKTREWGLPPFFFIE